jgi:hypothetical protein
MWFDDSIKKVNQTRSVSARRVAEIATLDLPYKGILGCMYDWFWVPMVPVVRSPCLEMI